MQEHALNVDPVYKSLLDSQEENEAFQKEISEGIARAQAELKRLSLSLKYAKAEETRIITSLAERKTVIAENLKHLSKNHNLPLDRPFSLWVLLSDELYLHIFSTLDVTSLGTISQVSSNMNKIAKDNYLWHKLHREKFIPADQLKMAPKTIPLPPLYKLYKEYYRDKVWAHKLLADTNFSKTMKVNPHFLSILEVHASTALKNNDTETYDKLFIQTYEFSQQMSNAVKDRFRTITSFEEWGDRLCAKATKVPKEAIQIWNLAIEKYTTALSNHEQQMGNTDERPNFSRYLRIVRKLGAQLNAEDFRFNEDDFNVVEGKPSMLNPYEVLTQPKRRKLIKELGHVIYKFAVTSERETHLNIQVKVPSHFYDYTRKDSLKKSLEFPGLTKSEEFLPKSSVKLPVASDAFNFSVRNSQGSVDAFNFGHNTSPERDYSHRSTQRRRRKRRTGHHNYATHSNSVGSAVPWRVHSYVAALPPPPEESALEVDNDLDWSKLGSVLRHTEVLRKLGFAHYKRGQLLMASKPKNPQESLASFKTANRLMHSLLATMSVLPGHLMHQNDYYCPCCGVQVTESFAQMVMRIQGCVYVQIAEILLESQPGYFDKNHPLAGLSLDDLKGKILQKERERERMKRSRGRHKNKNQRTEQMARLVEDIKALKKRYLTEKSFEKGAMLFKQLLDLLALQNQHYILFVISRLYSVWHNEQQCLWYLSQYLALPTTRSAHLDFESFDFVRGNRHFKHLVAQAASHYSLDTEDRVEYRYGTPVASAAVLKQRKRIKACRRSPKEATKD